MRKLLILIVILACTSSVYVYAAGSKTEAVSPEADLRHAFVKSVSHSCGQIPNHPVDFVLRREGFEMPVAVVRMEKDGTAILNPPGYSYRRMPNLNQLTPNQAVQLWSATGRDESSSCDRSYQLKNFKLVAFNIDLHFENNRLLRYRVRSSHYLQTKQKWIDVQGARTGFGHLPEYIEQSSYGDGPPKYYRLAPDTNGEYGEQAQLQINANGKPAFHLPSSSRQKMSNLSLEQMAKRFGPYTTEGNVRVFSFKGWNGKVFRQFLLEVRFSNGKCSAYQITGPGISQKLWQAI